MSTGNRFKAKKLPNGKWRIWDDETGNWAEGRTYSKEQAEARAIALTKMYKQREN